MSKKDKICAVVGVVIFAVAFVMASYFDNIVLMAGGMH